jgi:tetratricopeptide (TPR) repeat protein
LHTFPSAVAAGANPIAAPFPWGLAVLGIMAAFALGAPSGRAAESAAGELDAARALAAARNYPEAQSAYERLAKVDPENFEVQFQLGELALRRDDPATAVIHLEQAVRIDPKSARALKRLGDAHGTVAVSAPLLSKFGHAKKTLVAYERAVALDPSYISGREALFEYYRQAPGFVGGGFEKAAEQAARIKALDATRGRIAFATLYVGEKRYAEALAQFDEVLATTPDDYIALYQVGRLAALTGQQMDRGLAALRRCLELSPPPAPDTPSHAMVQWRLGTILEKTGDTAGARAAYNAALVIEPDQASAAEALRRLK